MATTGTAKPLPQITTEIVHLYREYYGRGPTRAKSYMLDGGFVSLPWSANR
jgi:uncharacterized protein YbcI